MIRALRAAVLVVAATCALSASVAGVDARTLALYAVREDTVMVFDALSGAPIRALHVAGVPNDVAVAPGGDLYVASYRQSTENLVISRFAPDAAAPFFTIVASDNLGSLAVSHTGELAVALNCAQHGPDCFSCRYTGPLRLLFFEPGQHRPSRVRSICTGNDGLSKPAYGPGGDLWLQLPYSQTGNVYSYLQPGSSRFSQVRLQTALAPLSYGPAIDGRGDLLVIDQGNTLKAYGAKTGQLRATIPIAGIDDAVAHMTVSPDGAYLFISTVHGFVCVYRYPAGGAPLAIYEAGGTGAIAVGFI